MLTPTPDDADFPQAEAGAGDLQGRDATGAEEDEEGGAEELGQALAEQDGVGAAVVMGPLLSVLVIMAGSRENCSVSKNIFTKECCQSAKMNVCPKTTLRFRFRGQSNIATEARGPRHRRPCSRGGDGLR